MHISTMLVFWSLVRNSVVLAVYLLFWRKKIRCSSPNKYFDLPCPHLYARCFQCQICGHYAWDCKRRFFQLCRYALSVSFNRLFPLRPIFYPTETACSLHAGDRAVPLIFSQSGAWEKGSFAASPADFSVRQYPVRADASVNSTGQWLPPLTCTGKLRSLYPCSKSAKYQWHLSGTDRSGA